MTADRKISELPAAAALDGTELVPVVQGGDNVRTTIALFASGGPVIATGGTTSRPIADHLAEPALSLLDFIDASKHAAIAAGTYAVALNTEIQAAFDSGENLFVPPGTYPVDCHGTSYLLMSTDGQKLTGVGADSLFQNIATAGTAVCPILIVEGADVTLEDLHFDHDGEDLINPTMGAAQIAFGDCLNIAGNRCSVNRLRVKNAWGNGIGIGKYDRTTGVQTNGLPSFVTVAACRTQYCGLGTETQLSGSFGIFNAGSGINNLTGGYACITDCTDLFSTQNFIQDYAGGGTSTWVACKGYGARKSRVGSYGSLYLTPGGQGFYNGGRANIFGMEIYDAEGDGFWFAGNSFYSQGVNLRAKGCKQRGLLLQGSYHNVNIFAEGCSYTNTGTYAAITVMGSAAITVDTFGNSTALVLDHPRTAGTDHKYGVEVVNGGGGSTLTVEGSMHGGYLNGSTAAFTSTNTTTFIATGYKVSGTNEVVGGKRTVADDLTVSATAANLNIDKTAGNDSFLNFRTGTSYRWKVGSESTSEGGTNTGSNFRIHRYGDNGVYIATPIAIARNTGLVSITEGLIVAGTSTLTGGAAVTGNVNATGLVIAYSGTAIPAGGTAGTGLRVSSTTNFGVFFGSSAPTLSAAKGSLYLRSDGTTTNDRMYVNTNGSTTWTAVTTVA